MRIGWVMAVAAALSAVPAGAAPFVVASGAFEQFGYDIISGFTIPYAPKYRFLLETSTPIDVVGGGVLVEIWYNQFCQFGTDPAFLCGGNNQTFAMGSWDRINDTTYLNTISLRDAYIIGDPNGGRFEYRAEAVQGVEIFTNQLETSGTWRITADAVPEPATWGLLILGFGAIGGAMRRQTSLRSSDPAEPTLVALSRR